MHQMLNGAKRCTNQATHEWQGFRWCRAHAHEGDQPIQPPTESAPQTPEAV